MREIILCLFVSLFSYTTSAEIKPVTLKCFVATSDYSDIESGMKFSTVSLSDIKHKEGGAKKVFSISELNVELWAMVHGVKTQDGISEIMNYQIALKDLETKKFIHALSSDISAGKVSKVRLSLVNYHPNSMLEAGELMFECENE